MHSTTKTHNTIVWEIHKFVISNKISRHYTSMNACTHNKITSRKHTTNMVTAVHMRCPKVPLQRHVQTWHIVHHRSPYNSPRSETPTTEITIQFIEFTYYNDIFIAQTRKRKTTKHQPLINNVVGRGWNVTPLMVLVTGSRATTYISSMKELETKLKLPTMQMTNTFKQINIIAIQYAHLILVHKRRLENRQPITNLHNLA